MKAARWGTDALIIVGLALLTYGLWLWWPPLAPIALGGILFGLGLAGALRGA